MISRCGCGSPRRTCMRMRGWPGWTSGPRAWGSPCGLGARGERLQRQPHRSEHLVVAVEVAEGAEGRAAVHLGREPQVHMLAHAPAHARRHQEGALDGL